MYNLYFRIKTTCCQYSPKVKREVQNHNSNADCNTYDIVDPDPANENNPDTVNPSSPNGNPLLPNRDPSGKKNPGSPNPKGNGAGSGPPARGGGPGGNLNHHPSPNDHQIPSLSMYEAEPVSEPNEVVKSFQATP